MCNRRADPDLGLGRVAVRRIPCACEACRSQFNQDWEPNVDATEQKRYASSTTCILWDIFEGLNDWNIVQLVPGFDNDEEEIQTIHRIVLDARIESLNVEEQNVGAFQTEDPDSDGYYLVKWTSQPYRLEENRELTEYNPPILVPKGELVADAVYFNPVPRAPRWYTPSGTSTTVRLQQVIEANLKVGSELNGSSILPNLCNKTEARRKGALRVSEHDHGCLLDEISRMEIIDFVEDKDDILECSGSDDGEESTDDDAESSSDSESSES